MSETTKKLAFSIDEHCQLWGYGRNTAYNEIANGELESCKIGRRRVITAEQEERYRKRKESQAA